MLESLKQEAACVATILVRQKRKRRKRRYWVHPIISQRLIKGQFFKLHEDLRHNPKKFFNYYRMSITSFDELLRLIGPYITHQDTTWRRCVSAEERLSVTIRWEFNVATPFCIKIADRYKTFYSLVNHQALFQSIQVWWWGHRWQCSDFPLPAMYSRRGSVWEKTLCSQARNNDVMLPRWIHD